MLDEGKGQHGGSDIANQGERGKTQAGVGGSKDQIV